MRRLCAACRGGLSARPFASIAGLRPGRVGNSPLHETCANNGPRRGEDAGGSGEVGCLYERQSFHLRWRFDARWVAQPLTLCFVSLPSYVPINSPHTARYPSTAIHPTTTGLTRVPISGSRSLCDPVGSRHDRRGRSRMVRAIRGRLKLQFFEPRQSCSRVIPYAKPTLSQPPVRTDNTRRPAPNTHFLVGIYRA